MAKDSHSKILLAQYARATAITVMALDLSAIVRLMDMKG
jgi:hypothetical protein